MPSQNSVCLKLFRMIVPVKENSSPAKFKQNKLYDFHIVLCILLLTLFMCLDKLLVPSLA